MRVQQGAWSWFFGRLLYKIPHGKRAGDTVFGANKVARACCVSLISSGTMVLE